MISFIFLLVDLPFLPLQRMVARALPLFGSAMNGDPVTRDSASDCADQQTNDFCSDSIKKPFQVIHPLYASNYNTKGHNCTKTAPASKGKRGGGFLLIL